MRKTLARVGVVAALIGGGILAVPAAAQASDRDCLAVYTAPGLKSALVRYEYNSCGGRSIRSRIILANAVDEACHTLRPGGEYRDEWTFGSYDGVKLC